jgi:hypothetical protein
MAGLAALLVLAAVGVTLRLLAFNLPAECVDSESVALICRGRQFDAVAYQAFATTWGGMVGISATILPAIAGVILGIAAVGKELDQHTAVLAWSVDASRRHWLLQRVVPLLVVVVALGLGGAQLLLLMFRLGSPNVDPSTTLGFEMIAYVGWAPAAVGISAFGIAMVVGAMLGRLLPTLLAASAFVLFAALIIQQGNEQLMKSESLVSEQPFIGQGRYVEQYPRTADGRIITWEEAYTVYADPVTGEMGPEITTLTRFVPVEIAPQVAARYVLLHLLVGLSTLTLAFAVVERRSP